MAEDINVILGSALEARGLTSEEASSLISVIHELLKASQYYITIDQHEKEIWDLREQIGLYLETIEAYRTRERQCIVGGCIDITTTEEIFLPVLETEVFLCNEHSHRATKD